ncbi:MAG TPA: sodium:proton antiporter NhaD [Chitinophagales bacterium]|nr:sodium:proton antiporter NhaD [Chitinophagales bacterium]
MVSVIITVIFIAGYAAISLENYLQVNKTATALLLGVACWLVYMLSNSTDQYTALHQLSEHLSDISEILFFLLGAMTIVELIDTHKGFRIVTDLITTTSKIKLLWIISIITFILSTILNNLTTAIVMISVLRSIVDDKKERMIMSSMVVIASNSGGVWSPIGDVTTTMLWIGGQVTTLNIIRQLFLPAVFSLLIPVVCQSFFIKGTFKRPDPDPDLPHAEPYSGLVFYLGIGVLISVPAFTSITHLPPYIGMLFGLGVLWAVTEIVHAGREQRKHLRVSNMISKIDHATILFFLGILLAVASLESMGILTSIADWMDKVIGNKTVIVTTLGLLSSVIDNVPLVAATMGMYPLTHFPTDDRLWELIAYCTGTGGSLLIIGSAAGVVAMGMENIGFFWYLKRISLTALFGYFAGIVVYLLMLMLERN